MSPARYGYAALVLCGLMLAQGACECRTRGGADREPGRSDEPGEAASSAGVTATPAPAMDTRTQYDLAAAMAGLESMRESEAGARMSELRQGWLGRRYRWRVFLVPLLCRSAQRCNVLPFDRGGDDRHIVQGWMPRLELTDAEHARLTARCEGQPRCAFRFEGTLSRFVLSTEELTSLGFSDVRILE